MNTVDHQKFLSSEVYMVSFQDIKSFFPQSLQLSQLLLLALFIRIHGIAEAYSSSLFFSHRIIDNITKDPSETIYQILFSCFINSFHIQRHICKTVISKPIFRYDASYVFKLFNKVFRDTSYLNSSNKT